MVNASRNNHLMMVAPEEAERLLDSLAEEEAETLRRRARQQTAGAEATPEEDW